MDSYRERTVAIQESLMNGGPLYPLSFFDSRRYVQHNVLLEDGVGAILAFVDDLPKDRTSARVSRSFEDGDHSVAHTDYLLGDWGAMVGFEIHRWEDGRIVEHWDNLQARPATANPSGRTMTDGGAVVREPDRTVLNKALATRFTLEVMIGRATDDAAGFFREGTLIQHNPDLPDGLPALVGSLAGNQTRYDRLHKVLGEGDIVLTICEGVSIDGSGASSATSFYDLYRIEDGFIAEHWDVVETIAPKETWRNSNGKF